VDGIDVLVDDEGSESARSSFWGPRKSCFSLDLVAYWRRWRWVVEGVGRRSAKMWDVATGGRGRVRKHDWRVRERRMEDNSLATLIYLWSRDLLHELPMTLA
jgi:hypothetical protein